MPRLAGLAGARVQAILCVAGRMIVLVGEVGAAEADREHKQAPWHGGLLLRDVIESLDIRQLGHVRHEKLWSAIMLEPFPLLWIELAL